MQNQKLVIVTGANKGIGYRIVEKLLVHPEKFLVLLTSRDIKRGQDAVSQLVNKYPEHKDRLIYHQLDIEFEKSIEEFAKWLKETYKTFYVLINNAALGDSRDIYGAIGESSGIYDPDFLLPEKETRSHININIRGTINLTEKLLPYLEDNGRIINLSSMAGELQYQGEKIQQQFNDPEFTREKLFKYLEEFEEKAVKQEHQKLGYFKSIYFATKVFINAYTRFVLPTFLKKDQTAFAVHPGRIGTDMGSLENGTLEEGIVSTFTVFNLPLKEAKELSFKYFDEFGKVRAF